MTKGAFSRESSALHDLANGPKWKNAQKCRWVIFPIFYLRDPCPLKNQKTYRSMHRFPEKVPLVIFLGFLIFKGQWFLNEK